MASDFKAFLKDQKGATAIEYAMIAGGISIAIAAVVMAIGQVLFDEYYKPVNDAFKR